MKTSIFEQSLINVAGKLVSLSALCLLLSFSAIAQVRPAASRTITVITEPKATVWIDDIKRGTTDETGKLTINNVPPGIHRLRVRATSFREVSQPLTAVQKGELKIALTKTTDEAEIVFQQGEEQRDKVKAVEWYRKAASLRPKYAEAYLALARTLTELSDTDEALKAVTSARRARPAYAEASAVEGRIYVADGEETKAIASFKRAIAEGKGVQPEAYTGLGLLYRDKADGLGSAGDLQGEIANLTLAAQSISTAVKQLSGSPDAEILMQILGSMYEKTHDYKKAIATYQEFLRIFPDSSERTAVESFIVQIKKQMNGEQ